MEWADRAVAYLMAAFTIWVYYKDKDRKRDPPDQGD